MRVMQAGSATENATVAARPIYGSRANASFCAGTAAAAWQTVCIINRILHAY